MYIVSCTLIYTHGYVGILFATIPESPRRPVDMDRRSGQAVEKDGEDGGEGQVIPSFQNAFNEALLSASVSVLAAQSSKFYYCIITILQYCSLLFVTLYSIWWEAW